MSADDHLRAAYRLARAILRDPTEAQDATHEAFGRAEVGDVAYISRFPQWFDQILVNS